MKAKKRLGQNFLQDQNIINLIADEISAFSNDLILEIGPGLGAITDVLTKKDTNYLTFEIDNDLKPILKKYESSKVKIIFEDFLTTNINNYLKDITYDNLYIVGNLPYYITTPILEKIINSNLNPRKIVIMVQKEVAQRFMASPASKDYGYFTIVLQHYFDINKVCDVSSKAFYPRPKVDSMVISLTPRKNIEEVNMTKFQEFLKKCFSQKRKTLHNNLKDYNWNVIKDILVKYGYNENVRAEELPEEVLIAIMNNI